MYTSTKQKGFPWWLSKKNLPANAGDVGLNPGLGRFPGEGNGNPLQKKKIKKFSQYQGDGSKPRESGHVT